MFKKLLLFASLISSTMMTLPCFGAQQPERMEEVDHDHQLFLAMPEIPSLFSRLPRFNPQEDMGYLDQESQDKIRGVAWHIREIFTYLDIKIGALELTLHQTQLISSQLDSTSLLKRQTITKYRNWQHQLSELQNACCFFLSSPNYGYFVPQLENIFKRNASLPEKDQEYLGELLTIKETPSRRQQLPGKHFIFITPRANGNQFFFIPSTDTSQPQPLQAIFALSDAARHDMFQIVESGDALVRDWDVYVNSSTPIMPPFEFLVRDFNSLTDRRYDFHLLKGMLSARPKSVFMARFATPVLAALADEINVFPDLYEQHYKHLASTIIEYLNPSLEALGSLPAQNIIEERIKTMKANLRIIEHLSGLERDFSQFMEDLSKSKLSYWQTKWKMESNS